ncbi:unnamed protein product, partial [marine sediment metagenome]
AIAAAPDEAKKLLAIDIAVANHEKTRDGDTKLPVSVPGTRLTAKQKRAKELQRKRNKVRQVFEAVISLLQEIDPEKQGIKNEKDREWVTELVVESTRLSRKFGKLLQEE